MKYGESTFDILYLLIAIGAGVWMLRRAKTQAAKRMGAAVLILGAGDAFHLIPRVANYFTAADLTAWLGFGKLVTSITMTVFYVLMYHIFLALYDRGEDRRVTAGVYVLAAARCILCLFPGNGWLSGGGTAAWAVARNAPFVLLGLCIVLLYFRERNARPRFRYIWLYVALSFLFYIPVAVAAGVLPLLGMLMLPKTVCYVLVIWTFCAAVRNGEV